MGAVSSMADFRGRAATPILVLVDLHVDFPAPAKRAPERELLSSALLRCRAALDHARKTGMLVAFVRHMPPLQSFLSPHECPPWLRGLEPRRSDMIFERALPSCYASSQFAQMASRNPEMALMGLFGETSCLATLIDAHHRSHHITYLADASCSRGNDRLSAEAMHRCVTDLCAAYGPVSSVQHWMQRSAVRMGAGL